MRYSLPVLVVVYDPETQNAYWQVITQQTVASTAKGWRINVPHDQILDIGARVELAALAAGEKAPDSAESTLGRLRADLTWMQVLDQGGTVVLEADEWINKSSGRGDLRLVAKPVDGGDAIERYFGVFFGSKPYAQALPEMFPWANLHVDDDALDDHDEDEWMEETGIWDSEEKGYIGNVEDFDKWRASRYPGDELRAYGESAGEVAHWRVWLKLNDLGRAVIALERHLSET
jgi:hypothetical protein